MKQSETLEPEIRSLKDDDVAAAVALWHDTGLTRPHNPPFEDAMRAILGPASVILGAFIDDELVGTAMVGHDGHRGWVYYLAVSPKTQKHGIGRTLMRASETWLLQHEIPKIQLMVRTTNEQVLGFYESIGYESQDVVVMGRRLDV